MIKKLAIALMLAFFICTLSLFTYMMGSVSSIEAEAGKQNAFEFVEDAGIGDIYYHKKTKVMYIRSDGQYSYGILTVMLDADGKPLLYKGGDDDE